MSVEDAGGGVQFDRTLADYQKFEDEMSVVSAVWKECKRLIEAYNEQQVSTDTCCFHCIACPVVYISAISSLTL